MRYTRQAIAGWAISTAAFTAMLYGVSLAPGATPMSAAEVQQIAKSFGIIMAGIWALFAAMDLG